jgi:hypothetical protein
MGHIRIGRIPKTKAWLGIFNSLESDSLNTAALAQATATAVQQEFSTLEKDRAINYCFWVLIRLATAARGDFANELKQIGVQSSKVSSGLGFVQQVSQAVEKELKGRGQSSVFVRIAELSLREVLSANIIEQSRSLFGTRLKEVQSACRALSTTKNFGQVAREFYATFISRSIQYVADKELSNYIGSTGSLTSPQQALEFQKSLSRYCYESSKIVEGFAGGWFSKNNWESNNNISEDAAVSFTSYALEKIQMELREGRK